MSVLHAALPRRVSLLTAAVLLASGLVEGAAATAAPLAAPAPVADEAGDLVAPDVMSAQLTARVKNRRVEVEALRAEQSTTYVNPDGSFTTDSFTGPVRFRRAGAWVDVDTTLVRGADGSVVPKAVPSALTLSGPRPGSGAGPLVTVGAGATRHVWQWRGALPEPVLDGDTATYPDVQPGVDLVVQASRTGFEQFFRLRERPSAAVRFELPVQLGSDANLSETGDGGLRVARDNGRELGRGPAPLMWDARSDAAGEPVASRRVGTEVATASGGALVTLSPDDSFLADPATVYPVTIDPQVSYTPTFDTWVAANDSTSHSGSTELRIGWNGSANHHAYINFPWTLKSDAVVSSATLSLWDWFAGSCTATQWQMWSTQGTATSSTVWSNAPALYSHYGDSTATKGATGCAAGWVTLDAQTMAQTWSNNNYTAMNIGLRAGVETDFSYYKKFNSGDASSNIPSMSVTYNRYPSIPLQSSLKVSPDSRYGSTHYANTTTPKLSALVTDPDGGTVKAQTSIYNADPVTGAATTLVTSLNSGSTVASGSRSYWTVPAGVLANGGTYRFYSRSHDGALQSTSASAGLSFTVDTTAPSASTVSSTAYPSGGSWNGDAGVAGNFTITPPSSDVGWIAYSLDNTSTAAAKVLTATASTAQTVSITPPTKGPHTLSVWTKDKAGNYSTRTSYTFNVGGPAITAPLEGDTTASQTALSATGPSGYTGVTFQYRLGGASGANWTDLPAGHVTNNGSALSAWPVTPTTSTGTVTASGLVWTAGSTISGDAAVQLRAVFTATGMTTSYTPPVTFTLDRRASAAGSDSVGPGSVNLLTGDYTISDGDGDAFGISVARSFSSLYPTQGAGSGQVAPFGPAWASGAQTPDSDYTSLTLPTANNASLFSSDGTATQFTNKDGVWTAEPGMTDLTLTGPATDGSYTLTDTSGVVTVFTQPSTSVATYTVATVTPPGSATTTRYSFEPVTVSGTTKLRLKRVIAPTSAISDLASCDVTTPPVGCRVLELGYATSTTATGTTAGTFGDYAPDALNARVATVTLWAATPASGGTPAAEVSSVMTRYAYDSTGALREVWDPRLTTPLKTSYSYDGNGRISTLTPPGEQPWTLSYDSSGRLTTAARPTLTPGTTSTTNGTATSTVVYGVALSGTGSPNDVSSTARSTWGQKSVPTTATAVIPPDPSTGAGSSTAFSRGTVHYLDVQGRETNTASAGHFDAVDFDAYGNTVRTLSAENRELALVNPSGTASTEADARTELAELQLSSLSSELRADALSSLNVYSADGILLTDSYGPRQQVELASAVAAAGASPALAAGDLVIARAHTHTSYDEGRPSNAATSNRATTVAVGAQIVGREDVADADVRITSTGYDWTLGQATSTTTDPGTGHLAITRTTVYDSKGRVWKTRMPNSSGGDAGETVTTYYTATGSAPCGGRPEWADLLCLVAPGGAISGGGTNPSDLVTTTTTYTRTGAVDTVSETANSVSRTTTTGYDAADRPVTVAITGGVGTALPTVTTGYDATSGRATTTSTTTGGVTTSITRGYDTLGRLISYTNADGDVTTTSYDAGDRPTVTASVAGSTPVARTAYTYDASIEPRGMATSVSYGTSATDPSPYTWTGRYGIDGSLTSATLPGSITLTTTDDTVGNATSRTYVQSGVTAPLLEDEAAYSIHGQQLTHDGLTHQDYSYDPAGRLTQVSDTVPAGDNTQQCTTRAYTYDTNSNRLGTSTVTGAAASGDTAVACPAAASVNTTMSYDTADRLVSTGYTYDAFGRTTALPSGLANAYYVNDLVQQQSLGTRTQSWTLDPTLRLRGSSTTVGSTTTSSANHYDSDDDSPAWISDTAGGTTTTHRYTSTLDGTLLDSGPTATLLQLANIHGDVSISFDLTTSANPLVAYTSNEFGAVQGVAAGRYGWLGRSQRPSDGVGGVILMGVRLYDPSLGRFLQTDPVYGGSANAYEYSFQDAVNRVDLDGRASSGAKMADYGGSKPTRCTCTKKNKKWHRISRVWTAKESSYGQTLGPTWGGSGIPVGKLPGGTVIPIPALDQTKYRLRAWFDRRCHNGTLETRMVISVQERKRLKIGGAKIWETPWHEDYKVFVDASGPHY